MESNLGGAATQADDLVTAARRGGHQACLLRFAGSPRAHGLWNCTPGAMPAHKLFIEREGIRFRGERILLTADTIEEVVKYLNGFDLLVFVGGCPHLTRTFTAEDFADYYKPIYTETTCHKVMFFTDPFWQKLYPFAADVIAQMDRVYAFAEAYRRIVIDSGLCDNVEICNFGSIAAADHAKQIQGRDSKNVFVWPHQWRSWKNPELFLLMAPHLKYRTHAYSDGIEYHKLRRDRWEDFQKAVFYDHLKQKQLSKYGKVTIYGTVPQEKIISEFATCRWMVDLTGMSGRTGKPLAKFVGNYQCVNMECMMLGCVNFKYENTVEPYNQVPQDCVISMPLITKPLELARFINSNLGSAQYAAVAMRAQAWASHRFDPERVFKKCFVNPFK
jgi:hypothetical protein